MTKEQKKYDFQSVHMLLLQEDTALFTRKQIFLERRSVLKDTRASITQEEYLERLEEYESEINSIDKWVTSDIQDNLFNGVFKAIGFLHPVSEQSEPVPIKPVLWSTLNIDIDNDIASCGELIYSGIRIIGCDNYSRRYFDALDRYLHSPNFPKELVNLHGASPVVSRRALPENKLRLPPIFFALTLNVALYNGFV